MKFIDRLSLLVQADAHGVLEQLEERTLLAKQHLREAELELTRKRARAEALEDESRRLAEEASRLDGEIRSLDEDVELALAGGKEELARYALRRLLPKRRASEELRRRTAESDEERQRLVERISAQEIELDTLSRRVRARPAADRAQENERTGFIEVPAADEEIEIELMRRRGVAEGV